MHQYNPKQSVQYGVCPILDPLAWHFGRSMTRLSFSSIVLSTVPLPSVVEPS
jgi:hypothetical protein